MYKHPNDILKFWLKVQLEGKILDQFEKNGVSKGYYEMTYLRRYVVDRKERGRIYRDDDGHGWAAEKEAAENYSDEPEDIDLPDEELQAFMEDETAKTSDLEDSPLETKAMALVAKVHAGIEDPENLVNVGQGEGVSLSAIVARAIEIDPENWNIYSKIGANLWKPVSNAEIVLDPEAKYSLEFVKGGKVEGSGTFIKRVLDDELPDYWIEEGKVLCDGSTDEGRYGYKDHRYVPIAHIKPIGPFVNKTISIRADQWEKIQKHASLNLSGFIQEKLDGLFISK